MYIHIYTFMRFLFERRHTFNTFTARGHNHWQRNTSRPGAPMRPFTPMLCIVLGRTACLVETHKKTGVDAACPLRTAASCWRRTASLAATRESTSETESFSGVPRRCASIEEKKQTPSGTNHPADVPQRHREAEHPRAPSRFALKLMEGKKKKKAKRKKKHI